jgi:transcription termination factor Rho
MNDPVLERSVLERKERDELLTIARALGAKPLARSRKADLVDLILTTAGILPAPADGPDGDPGADDLATDRAQEPGAGRPAVAASSTAGDDDGGAGDGDSGDRDGGGGADAGAEPAAYGAGGKTSGGKTSAGQASGGQASGGAPPGRPPPPPRPEGSGTSPNGDVPGRSHGVDDGPGAAGAPRPEDGADRGPGDEGEGDEGPNRRGRRRRGRDRGDRVERAERDPRAGDEPYLGEPVDVAGLLDLREEGYGFLRTRGYLPSRDDVYVSVKQVRQLGLRKGDHVTGASRPANRNEKNPALLRIDQVNGRDPELARSRPAFEDLTPLFPDERLRLEDPAMQTGDMTARIVDLVAPIGKGQRGLIVSPPKAGKTTVVKQIVKAIERNDPEVHLMVLLVDERPEEVTDMRRSTGGEVIASTFDRPAEEHTQLAELVIERAKRLVEDGADVVIVLDGITRLARAYNLGAPATGRIMSGGVDSGALYPPKRFFGAARNVEEGGSLTILATALVETGSRMDEVIFEEFKGTGNMELRLDRHLAERRIYPAIDVDGSSTRHEELLFDRKELQQVWRVRRALNALSSDGGSTAAALERLLDGLRQYRSNAEFLAEAARAATPAG